MAIIPTRPAIAATATLIAINDRPAGDAEGNTWSYLVKNLTGTAAVFLGGDNTVTAGTPAFQWDTTDGPLMVSLEPGEALWGIVTAVAQTLHVIRQGR